jgi:hypothetical protein
MLHVHVAYSDRFVDLVGEGFDAGVRMGYLAASNLVARASARSAANSSPAPGTSRRTEHQDADDLLHHETLMQGTKYDVSVKTCSMPQHLPPQYKPPHINITKQRGDGRPLRDASLLVPCLCRPTLSVSAVLKGGPLAHTLLHVLGAGLGTPEKSIVQQRLCPVVEGLRRACEPAGMALGDRECRAWVIGSSRS